MTMSLLIDLLLVPCFLAGLDHLDAFHFIQARISLLYLTSFLFFFMLSMNGMMADPFPQSFFAAHAKPEIFNGNHFEGDGEKSDDFLFSANVLDDAAAAPDPQVSLNELTLRVVASILKKIITVLFAELAV